MKIAAIVVTFNRKELLLKTLEGLESQTHPVDHIFVIDNASVDGTKEMLNQEGVLDLSSISYDRLEKNTGGAGGFRHGLEVAISKGYDWFWTMDDDVEPEPEALSNLLKFTSISECLNSRKVFSGNGEEQYWEQYFDFATFRLVDLKNSSFDSGKDWCPVNVACFEGMLVSKAVLEKAGLPDASYFIYHDDTIFGAKASLFTNVIYVRDAVFKKHIYGYGAPSPFRAYYSIRNGFKAKREYFATGVVGKATKFTNFLFFINLSKFSLGMLKAIPSYSMTKSILRGWVDGLKGR